MEPTLYAGDLLLVLHGGRVRPGRLAVVRLGGVIAVKRIAWREPAGPDSPGDRPGGWWVQRDNPYEGIDSLSHGAVADDQVIARVLARLWPPVGGRRITRWIKQRIAR
ncbi:MAG: S24 family peptidase [Nocardioidaceae bacterium]|nr:MAG: S24 family peptidase [Nocardioidaceae bacterium]